jgi:hypothetical protein
MNSIFQIYENYYRLQFLSSIKLLDGDIALEIYLGIVLNNFLQKCSYLYSAELKRQTSIILERLHSRSINGIMIKPIGNIMIFEISSVKAEFTLIILMQLYYPINFTFLICTSIPEPSCLY